MGDPQGRAAPLRAGAWALADERGAGLRLAP